MRYDDNLITERPTFVTHLECSATGEHYQADALHNLSRMGKPLLVRYDLDGVRGALTKAKIASEQWIPVMLAISTAFGVLANLAFGKAYDRVGLPVVIAAVCVSAAFSPFVFLGGFWLVLFGMLLWGVGYATQDTLLKAIVAEVLPEGKRNFAFGLYYAGYGVGWLAGSIVAGLLYENSLLALILFSIVIQLASVPVFLIARRQERPS